MKTKLRIASMLLVTLLVFSYDSLKAQVKIGGDPTKIDENAILELESTRRGLLLPRLTATGFTTLNTSTTIQDGMLIYLKETSGVYMPGLYVRAGNQWLLVSADVNAGGPWKLDGNDITGAHWLGSKNNQSLRLRTNNTDRFTITGAGEYLFAGVQQNLTENDVVLIDGNGKLWKKPLNITAVSSLQGISGDLTFGFTVNAAGTGVTASSDNTTKVVSLDFPVMMGAAGQNYGFISLADWQALQSVIAADGFSLGALVSEALPDGAKFEKDAGTGKWVLSLNEASATAPGLVSINSQTFAGAKTFANNARFNANVVLAANSAFTFTGGTGKFTLTALPVEPVSTTTYELLTRDAATGEVRKFQIPALSLAGGITGMNLPTGTASPNATTGKIDFQIDAAATDYTIVGDNASTVKFGFPDATATNRGAVTIAAQTFAGAKTFNDAVDLKTSAVVGSAAGTVAGGVLNVKGGISVQTRELTAGNIADDDYIVFIKNVPAGGQTVNLPTAVGKAGKMVLVTRTATSTDPAVYEAEGTLTIGSAGGTINGGTDTKIISPFFTVTFVSDGTNWRVVSRVPSL
ncbi:hypothetical protein ACWKWU_05510 [Chitinophaga lutea]